MPEAAATYPGPYAWVEQGIRRYGFHGISHQYVAQRAADLLGRDIASLKILTCHLGNGCSLAAVKGGMSIDTTMGFTPLDGVMMGSRSGSVDPGILIHLLRQEGYSADQLDTMLNKESGLKGLSGLSNDMRVVVEAMDQGHPQATLAVDVFIHRLRREMGAMIASLGGLDVVVFTAGIGENKSLVWQRACEPFEFLGLRLKDGELGRAKDDQDIAAADSRVRVLVIHTQEEWAIAQACVALLQ
jgi:acetate kinase